MKVQNTDLVFRKLATLNSYAERAVVVVNPSAKEADEFFSAFDGEVMKKINFIIEKCTSEKKFDLGTTTICDSSDANIIVPLVIPTAKKYDFGGINGAKKPVSRLGAIIAINMYVYFIGAYVESDHQKEMFMSGFSYMVGLISSLPNSEQAVILGFLEAELTEVAL